jgi:hypothetical protein
MNQHNAYDSASKDGQASKDSRTSEDGCEREASEDGRTVFDL